MKYIDEFRDPEIAEKLSRRIRTAAGERPRNFMEVCGTHTNTFYRFGLKKLLPENLRLISGPGCPVCVTDSSYIDNAVDIAGLKGVILATFGDMLKVPGSSLSLYRQRARGADIRTVYSPLDALKIAEENPSKDVVFLGVGFETTSPAAAMTVLEASRKKIKNFSVYSAHKLIPPAIKAVLRDGDAMLDGFILPAHVSSIIGASAYGFLAEYRMSAVIAGFEPLDMLQGILMLLHQLESGRTAVLNQYNRVVTKEGNKKARLISSRVFAVCDAAWRGLGVIPRSGLAIRRELARFDAGKRFKMKRHGALIDTRCLCGDIIKGLKTPEECRLFGRTCTPSNPKGPCMVSGEGACGIHLKYKA